MGHSDREIVVSGTSSYRSQCTHSQETETNAGSQLPFSVYIVWDPGSWKGAAHMCDGSSHLSEIHLYNLSQTYPEAYLFSGSENYPVENINYHREVRNFLYRQCKVWKSLLTIFPNAQQMFFHKARKELSLALLNNGVRIIKKILTVFLISCLSHCSISVKRHQGNFGKRKHLFQFLLTVAEVQSIIIMSGSTEACR